jgi:diacylglycerol kinase family enzyme
MRALLVMNPAATSTTERSRDVLVNALAAQADVTVVPTEFRGHATELAATAVEEHYDLVISLGGDGTVNEVVNGLLADREAGDQSARPALAVLPGGSTNVFARALGLPNDPVEATGAILDALRAGRRRSVSVGQADERFFTFSAGFGFDAAVVAMVERERASGKPNTGGRYVRLAVQRFMAERYGMNAQLRRSPIRVELHDGTPVPPLFMAMAMNTSPWTYLGSRAIVTTPEASFESGLDLFGLSSMTTPSVVTVVGRLLSGSSRLTRTRGVVVRHDAAEIEFTSEQPLDFHVDGDYLGARTKVTLRNLPNALRVVV